MDRANAFENLAYQRRFRGVRKPLVGMPAGQCRQSLAQRVDGQCFRVIGQVAGNGIRGGWQQPFPLDLKMADGRSVAAAGVVALGGFDVLVQAVHLRGNSYRAGRFRLESL